MLTTRNSLAVGIFIDHTAFESNLTRLEVTCSLSRFSCYRGDGWYRKSIRETSTYSFDSKQMKQLVNFLFVAVGNSRPQRGNSQQITL